MNSNLKNIRKKLPINYSMGKILKRVFLYALKSKGILFISILFLIVYSALDIVQPLIIKKVIDNELSGVQTVWVKINEENDNTITYNNEFYQKASDEIDGDKFTIRYVEELKGYILITGEFFTEDKVVDIVEDKVVINSNGVDNQHSYIFLDDDITNFYEASIDPIYRWVIIFAIISVIILVSRYIQHVSFTSASMKLTLDIRKTAFDKLNKLPIEYFSKEPSGKTVTKVIYDSEGVRGLYDVMFSIFSAFVSLIVVYIGLFYLDTKLALLTFLAFPIIYIWLTVYRKTVNKYNHIIREMNSRINGKLAEFVNGVGVIQVFNKEKEMSNEYDEMLTYNYETKMKHLKINTSFGFDLLMFIQRIITAFVLLYFGLKYFSVTTLVTATMISVFIDYVERLIRPISDIFSNLNALEDSLVSASRIFEFLDEVEDPGMGEISGVKFHGNIDFKNINFAYQKDNYVLKDVSFSVKQGNFIGLVGHTGSGKSTIMSLLERYYELEDGHILIDNVDFKEYTKQDVRNNIGIILQDAAIFEGTIKSNVAFGAEATDEEIEQILLSIGASKFVNEYPDGIHSKVAYRGENLSTGEKQLIAFARILLRNPSIMILDEATANIDTETESLIQNALAVLSKDRTTFVVAHRLSTIKNADMIYVLEDGRIVEAGRHEDLYHKPNGKYKAMYDAQYQK